MPPVAAPPVEIEDGADDDLELTEDPRGDSGDDAASASDPESEDGPSFARNLLEWAGILGSSPWSSPSS
jgi:hypothetical protein